MSIFSALELQQRLSASRGPLKACQLDAQGLGGFSLSQMATPLGDVIGVKPICSDVNACRWCSLLKRTAALRTVPGQNCVMGALQRTALAALPH